MQGNSTETGRLIINLSALSQNYRLFQEKIGKNCQIAGVVKGNAYGLGVEHVFKTLQNLACPQYFVATLEEALKLRSYDKKAPIAVLGGLFTGAEKTYTENNITPVLNSPDDINRWSSLAKQKDVKLPAFLHFDTGMNRLGLSASETKNLLENQTALDGINVQLIMSHFACADDKDHPLTVEQANKFAKISKQFPNAKKSLANSPGLFAHQDYHYDLARPGYALYGGNPTPHTTNPMQPVVSLEVRILQIRDCLKGESIGYGASYVFEKDTRTATIALGYADGFIRSHSSDPNNPNAKVFYNGTPCDVIGRVSMDLVTIDISACANAKQGDWVEVLGKNQGVDDLASAAGTIGYEILTSLGSRYKRNYITSE